MGEVIEIEGVARGLVYDERPARWRVGVIALATDHTTERDFARMCPSTEVAIYVTRVFNQNPTTVENLRRMKPRLTEAFTSTTPWQLLNTHSIATATT